MKKFCTNCGAPVEEGKECAACGNGASKKAAEVKVEEKTTTNTNTNTSSEPKNKIVALLLAWFLGALGIHNFYLGYKKKGLTQLIICLAGSLVCGLGALVAGIWALVDFFMILLGNINTDADGNPIQ